MSSPIAPPPYSAPTTPPTTPSNGLAVAALVVGIVAFLIGLLPVVGLLAGLVAVVLGVLALRRPSGRGPAIIGLALGAIAALTGLISTIVLVAGLATGGTTSAPSGAAAVVTPAPAATEVAASPAPSVPAVEPVEKTAAPEPKPEPVKAGADYGGYPKSQARFVKIVERAADDYADTSNELKGAKVLKTRDRDACAAAGSKVKSWVGTVHGIGATGDGDGWVEIEVAPSIVIETWNNSLSDAFDSTLIPSSASFYDRLSDLDEGDKVVFSGKFVPADDSCLDTTNLTKTFNAADPNFLFRFTNVRAQ